MLGLLRTFFEQLFSAVRKYKSKDADVIRLRKQAIRDVAIKTHNEIRNISSTPSVNQQTSKEPTAHSSAPEKVFQSPLATSSHAAEQQTEWTNRTTKIRKKIRARKGAARGRWVGGSH